MGANQSPGTHTHTHAHSHNHRDTSRKNLIAVLLLISVYMVVEFIGGLLTQSLALMADAGHMLSDVAALALSLFAMGMARRPATPSRTFGFYRTEILAALFNGATLIAIAAVIIIEAYQRLSEPREIQGPAMMAIATAGLVVNIAALMLLHGGRASSLNIKGAYLHVLGDTLGSVGAILAGAAVWFFGWYWADPVVSAAIAILITAASWNLVRQSVAVLMEGTPGGINVDSVREAILDVPGIADVHDLHVWSITSGLDSLSAHVTLHDSEINSARWNSVLNGIRTTLHEKFHIDHVTIQLEPPEFPDASGAGHCVNCEQPDAWPGESEIPFNSNGF